MADTIVIDRGWERIKKDLRLLDNSYTKVGVQQGELHIADGEVSDMAVIAASDNYGVPSKNIPPRRYMDQAFDENIGTISRLQEKLYDKVSKGHMTVKSSLAIIGEFFTGKVKKKIRALKVPANAESTLKRKYPKTNPLIDKGQLVQSQTHVEVLN